MHGMWGLSHPILLVADHGTTAAAFCSVLGSRGYATHSLLFLRPRLVYAKQCLARAGDSSQQDRVGGAKNCSLLGTINIGGSDGLPAKKSRTERDGAGRRSSDSRERAERASRGGALCEYECLLHERTKPS